MSEEDRARWNGKHAAAPLHEPEPFVVACVRRLQGAWPAGIPRTALDVACGTGRHALLLAREGFDVLAVDVSDVAIERLAGSARDERLPVRARRLDVDAGLPPGRFGLVLCTHFLARPLWPALRAAVEPGGYLLFQTFAATEAELTGFPRRFCLDEGELLRELEGFEVIEREVATEGRRLESVLARRPSGAS